MPAWRCAMIALGCILPAAAAAQISLAQTLPTQTWPSKPITIVTSAAPGGVTDALGRLLAQRFTAAWGQQAVVEPIPVAPMLTGLDHMLAFVPDAKAEFMIVRDASVLAEYAGTDASQAFLYSTAWDADGSVLGLVRQGTAWHLMRFTADGQLSHATTGGQGEWEYDDDAEVPIRFPTGP